MRRLLELPVIVLLAVVTACGHNARDGSPVDSAGADSTAVVDVSVAVGSITVADSIESGWRTIRVSEDSASHIVVLFRLPTEWRETELSSLLAAIDTGSITPPPAIALGGPEIGSTGEVILNVTPGVYVVACVARGEDGHRHAARGEARVLVANRAGGTDAEPVATDSIDMSDFAFLRGETWKAGKHLIRITNRGAQDHQLRIARVRDGTTAQQLLAAENPGELLTGIAGMARMSPGETAFLPIELSPGLYMFTCLVRDPKTGKAHIELGMFRPVNVQ